MLTILIFTVILGSWIYLLSSFGMNRTLPPENRGYYVTKDTYEVLQVKEINAGFKGQKVMRDKITIKVGKQKRYFTVARNSGIQSGNHIKLKTQEFWVGDKAPEVYSAGNEQLSKEELQQDLRFESFKYKVIKQ